MALSPEAPHVHEGDNVLRRWHLRKGDVALGFRQAGEITLIRSPAHRSKDDPGHAAVARLGDRSRRSGAA